MTHETFGMRVLKIEGGTTTIFLLAQERNRGFLLRKGFKDRVMATKAKDRVDHPKVGDISRSLASQYKVHVSIATSLDTRDVITPQR